ncbi:hypothetical protein KKF84_05525 [Myxococcota bacterium]|nr:hypothetical protein [Myxococcota bacterium]MBU1534758.1 hypothetical protein [Myxococcota bacterium]
MALEIERRFLLTSLPDVPWATFVRIRQGYLGEHPHEVRLREQTVSCCGASWVLCKKSGTGLVREETELPVTKAHFDMLWPLFQERSIEKTRHVYTTGDFLNWEVDLFEHLRLASGAPLIIMEVELPHPSYALTIPSELASLVLREVTGESQWLNTSLARHGLPAAAGL